MNPPITPSTPPIPRSRPLLSLALLGVGWLCTSCGTATTGLDERCADLADTGYNQLASIEALLRAAQQPTAGQPDVLRQRAMAFCQQLGSGNLAKP